MKNASYGNDLSLTIHVSLIFHIFISDAIHEKFYYKHIMHNEAYLKKVALISEYKSKTCFLTSYNRIPEIYVKLR